jgi:DNA-binding LacI/PurR family transcriptional regulator
MLGSITRAAARTKYDVLISFQSLSDNWHLAWEDSRKADGLILLGYGDYETYRPRLERLVEQGSHFVRWGSPEAQPNVSKSGHTIGSDNRLGGRLAGEALLAKGRRRLAFLGDASDHYPEFHDRYLGLKEVAGDALVAQEDALTLERHGYDAAARLFARVPDVDAVFAGSDLIAIGALQFLKESGRRVPEDVSVIGYDDISAAQHAIPPLTTIRQDSRAAGRHLVAQLLGMIEGQEPGENRLPVSLIERASA